MRHRSLLAQSPPTLCSIRRASVPGEERPPPHGPLASGVASLESSPFMALFAPPRSRGQPPVLACRGSCGSDAAGR